VPRSVATCRRRRAVSSPARWMYSTLPSCSNSCSRPASAASVASPTIDSSLSMPPDIRVSIGAPPWQIMPGIIAHRKAAAGGHPCCPPVTAHRGLRLSDYPSAERIAAARARLNDLIIETPVHRWRGPEIAAAAGADTEVVLKLELFQYTGSFK